METARIAASGADAAEDALRPFFLDVRMGSDTGERFAFKLEAHAVGEMTMIEYGWVASAVRATAEAPGFTVLRARLSGRLGSGRDDVDVSVPFLFADPLWTDTAAAHARMVQFDGDAMRQLARRMLGEDGFLLSSSPLGRVTSEHAALWDRSCAYAFGLCRSGAADDPMIGVALTEFLMTTSLRIFPTNWTEACDRRDDRTPLPAAVRRAQAYIDEHFASPVTVVEIAEAARLSVRGLQLAFQRHLGRTPGDYLRWVRLSAARTKLLDADPAQDHPVADIARAAGFAHVSRFAARYRDAFGELPSETLRR